MVQKFFLPGPLPGINEIITACKGFRGRGTRYAQLKRLWGQRTILAAKAAGLLPAKGAVKVHFHWLEKARRRDPDNFCGAGPKFIMDGLVDAGVLVNDGWNEVHGLSHSWAIDRRRPGVWVTIEAA